jgi:dihydrofolate reductase
MTTTVHPTRLPESAVLVAMTRDLLIGSGNRLPWDIPEDRGLFRDLTLGNTVIMGRRTFQSIGSPLEDRNNIVLSRTTAVIEGILICRTFLESLAAAMRFARPVFFIGGVDVYRSALQIVDSLHVSWIDGTFQGDRYFPAFDPGDWQILSQQKFNEFEHIHYRRVLQA